MKLKWFTIGLFAESVWSIGIVLVQDFAFQRRIKEKDSVFAAREAAWQEAWDERQERLESEILMDVNGALDFIEEIIANKCVGMLPITLHYDADIGGAVRFMAENDEQWDDGVSYRRRAFPISIPITQCVDGEEKAAWGGKNDP